MALRFEDVSRSYRRGSERLDVLVNADLRVAPGEVVALTGPSGSGKSTVLHLAAGIDVADIGSVHAAGRPLGAMSSAERATWRRDRIGLVFQAFHLLGHLTVRENIALPALLGRGARMVDVWARADALIEALGLEGQSRQRAGSLSGGQAQRAAVGRALFNHPALVLADEPTGNLDEATGAAVLDLLWDAVAVEGAALLVATHDLAVAERADRVLVIRDGRIVERAMSSDV